MKDVRVLTAMRSLPGRAILQDAAGGGGGAGATGPAGPQGPPGETGAAGATGVQGSTGPQGNAGLQGPPGLDGASGATGPAGAQGATGTAGAAGEAGAAGPQGPQGATGADSTVAGPAGPPGAQGIQGLTGDAGAVGTAGAPGVDSTVAGPQGAQGIQGIQGPEGPAGSGNDPRITTRFLLGNQADITGTTLIELASLTVASLVAGMYQFVYRIIYQTTAITTGVEVVVDHSGTLTEFVSNAYFGSTGGAAATGIADQQGVGTAAGLMEVKAARAKNTRPGVTIGVDSANANTLMTIEGVFVSTTLGDLKLMMAAELAALVVRAMRGSSLVLTKIS